MAKLKERKLLRQERSLEVGDIVKIHPSVSGDQRLQCPGQGIILAVIKNKNGGKTCRCSFSARRWTLRKKAMQFTEGSLLNEDMPTVLIKEELLVYIETSPESWTQRPIHSDLSKSRFSRLRKK